jgi:transaldolase
MPDFRTVLSKTPKRGGIAADHGEPKARLEQDVKEARRVLERLLELGISIDNVTRQLEDEGVEKFNKPFDKRMETLAQRSPRHLTEES